MWQMIKKKDLKQGQKPDEKKTEKKNDKSLLPRKGKANLKAWEYHRCS